MNFKGKALDKLLCEKPRAFSVIRSKEAIAQANETLRWFLNEILYAETWKAHPYYKILIGSDVASRLDEKGFSWQAERLRNHLRRWMKSISCKSPERFDTLSKKERREDSL